MKFSKELKFGILQTLVFYIFGFITSGIIYLIFGHPYIHAPGLHHIAILLMYLIGVIWALISVIYFFSKKKTDNLRGIIITNLILIFIFIMYLSVIVNS